MKNILSRYQLLILLFIVIVAAALRVWGIGHTPISPDWDEAALGYNAYSILHTGKDEYGKAFPVILQSFGDYKPALYAYTIIPFIVFFDLSTLAVRLPSAFFGILTVIVTFFLVKELFKRVDIALLSSFFLAISPWHIQFSRVAFEANLGLTCNVLAVFFFLKGITNKWGLLVAAFFASLSLYSYQSEKVFVPLLFVSLGILFRNELLSIPRKYMVGAIVIGLVTILPMIVSIAVDHHSLSRAKQTSIFAKQTDLSERYEKRMIIDSANHDVVGLAFDNKYVYFFKEIFGGYISHFDLNWLFIKGDLNRHHAPGMGLLYLFELPLLLLGIYSFLVSKTLSRKYMAVVILWFLLAPIPASITTDVPHSVRTLNFLPTFQIFISFGVVSVCAFLRMQKKWIAYLMGILFICFAGFNVIYYLNQYFVQQNYFYSEDWQYGYAQTVAFVQENENKFDRIIISDSVPMDQSYIFFLFYEKYSPALYQRESKKGSLDYSVTFGKYVFKHIDWQKDKQNKNVLLLGTSVDFPSDIPRVFTVPYLDGKPAIQGVLTQ